MVIDETGKRNQEKPCRWYLKKKQENEDHIKYLEDWLRKKLENEEQEIILVRSLKYNQETEDDEKHIKFG